MIELRDVSRVYRQAGREVAAVRNVSFTLKSGEFLAVFGRSGSGKTTLLNLACGIEEPTGGEVVFSGKSLSAMGDREKTLLRRHKVGFVFQFFNLLPTLRAKDNVLLPARLAGASTDEASARADALIEMVGLTERARFFPDTLSGGEQQRLAIARALMNDPELILADEPTGNLDEENSRAILTLLRDAAANGKPVMMVTHSAEVRDYANRFARMHDGELVFE